MICYNLFFTCVYFVLIGGTSSNNFIPFEDYEYYFGNRSQKGNYAYGQRECLKRNATLVIISTEAINQFIQREVQDTGLNYYIGLQRINENNNNSGFKWIDGTSLTFDGWGGGGPSNSGKNEMCGEARSNGWNDLPCNLGGRSFICQRKVQSCNISKPCGENSHCDDSTGYIRCPCNEGYEGDGFINCTDIDECKTIQNLSFPNSVCSNIAGSFHIDVQSCNISNPCGENSHCDDSTGYIRCTCNEGYEGDGFINCTDIDECETLQNLSFLNLDCSNIPGSFNIYVDACSISNPCGANSHCDDSTGHIRCLCNRGYEGDGFIGCTDIDECATLVNLTRQSGNCVNTPGSYQYINDSDKISFSDVAMIVGILIGVEVFAGIIFYVLYKWRQHNAKIVQNETSVKFNRNQDRQMVDNEIYESTQEAEKPEPTYAVPNIQKKKMKNGRVKENDGINQVYENYGLHNTGE